MTFELRRAQRELTDLTLSNARAGDAVTVGAITVGQGKTVGYLSAYIAGSEAGLWDRVAIYVPRNSLARQVREDWDDGARNLPGWELTDAPVRRTNSELFTSRGRPSGSFIATHTSLARGADTHLAWAQANDGRFVLVVDEAHLMGTPRRGDRRKSAKPTKAALALEAVAAHAAHVIMVTGTPFREDSMRMPLVPSAMYRAAGKGETLDAHVTATYADGIAEGVVTPFQFVGMDAQLTVDGAPMLLSEVGAARDVPMTPLLRQANVWRPIVRAAVGKLVELRAGGYPTAQLLVAAQRQDHAREMAAYVAELAPALRTVVAVSDDGKDAQEALAAVRGGHADVLCTVKLAFIGYSSPPLTVCAMLTNVRADGHLEQLVGRVIRVDGNAPDDVEQCAYVYGPADAGLRDALETIRSQEKSGEVTVGNEADERDPNGQPRTAGVVVVAELEAEEAMYLASDPLGDLSVNERTAVLRLMREAGVDPAVFSPSLYAATLRRRGELIAATGGEKLLRAKLSPRMDPTRATKAANASIFQTVELAAKAHGWTPELLEQQSRKSFGLLKREFGPGPYDVDTNRARIAWVVDALASWERDVAEADAASETAA